MNALRTLSLHSFMHLFFQRALAAICLILATAGPVAGETLPSGLYRCSLEFGAVMLDGTYPLEIGDLPGTIEVTTSPKGALSGRATILHESFPITGQMTTRQGSVRVVMRAKAEGKRFLLKATLRGGAFVGTLTFGKFRSACRFDVSSTGPIVVKYALSLNVAPNGVISGPGTLFSARKEVPVKIRGRVSNKGVVTLTVKGGSTLLMTSTGRVQGESVTATRWIGHGFGALLKGKALALQRDP